LPAVRPPAVFVRCVLRRYRRPISQLSLDFVSFGGASDSTFGGLQFRYRLQKNVNTYNNYIQQKLYIKIKKIKTLLKCSRFKAVPASSSGLIHPRRTKLQHGTFLHFGHPRL